MAVTLITDDLTLPNGELSTDLFPDNCETLLVGWLQQAAAKVEASEGITTAEQNEAAAAWVYYRAYTAVADRMAQEAESITVGPRTERTGANRFKYFMDRANYWLGVYQALDAVEAETPVMAFFGTVKTRRYCGTRY